MAGEILAKLNVRAGAPVTKESLEEAKKLWMEIYLFFMLLMAPTNPIKHLELESMKEKLAEVSALIKNLEL